MKAAAAEKIPIIGDLYVGDCMKFMHYDYLDDLSIQEERFVHSILMEEARKMGFVVNNTLSRSAYAISK